MLSECTVQECVKPLKARGLCTMHLWRLDKWGEVGPPESIMGARNLMCSNHPDRKAKAKGLCDSCYNVSLYNKNPELKKRKSERRKKADALSYATRDHAAHAKKQLKRRLLHRYGLSVDEYEQMHITQNNKCAICGNEGGNTRSTRLFVDHNHKTGKIRELLCPKCNMHLAVIEQGIPKIIEFAKYLHKHDESNTWNALARLELMLRK